MSCSVCSGASVNVKGAACGGEVPDGRHRPHQVTSCSPKPEADLYTTNIHTYTKSEAGNFPVVLGLSVNWVYKQVSFHLIWMILSVFEMCNDV